jgi:hypothetical protein
MTKKLDTTFIQIVHPVCCGLDVHKKKISACLITVDNTGKEQYETITANDGWHVFCFNTDKTVWKLFP